MRKKPTHTCAKCGSKNAEVWMDEHDYLCDKCHEKWKKHLKKNVHADEWAFKTYDATWNKQWNKFISDIKKEKVVFT